MRAAWVAWTVLPLLLTTVDAQQPVPSCSRDCWVGEPDQGFPQTRPPVPVILYGHMWNTWGQFPLNTQAPTRDLDPDLNEGLLMPTIESGDGQPSGVHFRNNEFVFFSMASDVENFQGSVRFPHGGGIALARDLRLADRPVTGYFYLSPTIRPGDLDGHAFPSVVADIRLEMTIGPYRGHDGLYAEGRSARGILLPGLDGSEPVYEFAVPMPLLKTVWPAGPGLHGIRWTVRVTQVELPGNIEFAQSGWSVRSGPQYPPRLVLQVLNPLEVALSPAQRVDDAVMIRGEAISPFGSYDVADGFARLEVEGTPAIEENRITLLHAKRGMDHESDLKPVRYLWSVNVPSLDGYLVTMHARTRQGSFEAADSIRLPVKTFAPGSEIPGFELLLGALALVGAAFLPGRR